ANLNVYLTGKSQPTFSGNFDCFTVKLNSAGVQQWVSRYAAGVNIQSFGNAIAVDGSGNVYVAGCIDPPSAGLNWLVIKYNAAGVQQWADVLNGPGNSDDEALDIVVAPNGNATACGYVYDITANGFINAFVKQYDVNGGTVWTDTYTNPAFNLADRLRGLAYNNAGNLFVSGETANSANSKLDVLVMSYNAAGVRQWETIYMDSTSSNDEYLLGNTFDDLGNAYVVGTDYSNGFITRVNFDGTQGWRRKWTGPLPFGNDVLFSVAVDNNGGVYTSGRCIYPGPDYYGNGGLTNMIITKYSEAGDSLWTYRVADSTDASMGIAIATRNGKVYGGGFKTDTAHTDENLYVIALDTAGNGLNEWNHNGQGHAITHGQLVRTDAADNVYCASTIDRLYNEGLDVVVVKYNPAGNLLWEKYYSTPSWNNDTITDMQFNPAGELILCISSDSAKSKNNYRMSLVRMDTNGNFLDTSWYLPSPLGSTLSSAMFIRNDGSVVIGANSNIEGGLLLYFNNQHVLQWSAKMDSTQFAVTKINSVAPFPNGDIVVAGLVQVSSGNTAKGVVQRFQPSGIRLWSADYDSVNVYDEIKDVTVSASGEVAVVGISGYLTTGTSALITYDGSTGTQQWRAVYNPNTTNEFGVKVRYSPAGNIVYICRGWTGFVARYITLQYTGSGTFQWATVYNQTASDREPVKLLVEPNNRIVTAGWEINTGSSNFDFVLVGYNASGIQQFRNNYTSPNLNPDRLYDLTRDSQGNFIVIGESSIDFLNEYRYQMITIKYGGSAVGIQDVENPSNVIAYPNPSNGTFLLVEKLAGSTIINGNVYDLQGRKVTTLDLINREINLTKFPSGLYVLQYQRENGSLGSLKLILSPHSY
ncbi:MAG: T9SS type A sorting domain-containing protein, partial [Bacteroidia bacterium]